MPIYEFRCNDTGQPFEVSFKSVAEYEASQITSPYTGSGNVSRLIRRVTVKKMGLDMKNVMKGDIGALHQLGEADPRSLAYGMQSIADESGGPISDGFREVVTRLEAGESPTSIEKKLPSDLPIE
jgi:hypothetical protein